MKSLKKQRTKVYNNNMPNLKKKKKKKSVVSKIVGIVFLLIALVVFIRVGKELVTMIELQNEQKVVSEELQRLKEENQSLLSTKSKLEDPNYVTTYARGEYMFSKGDEKLFRLPSSNE